jgi:hypothetical protein
MELCSPQADSLTRSDHVRRRLCMCVRVGEGGRPVRGTAVFPPGADRTLV